MGVISIKGVKWVGDPQVETLQRLTRVETKIDSIEEKLDSVINTREVAVEALQSTKSAHRRLDRIEDNQKWLWRTFAGAFILAITAFIISGGLK